MDGVLIIDKPAGPTSHDVVGRVRRKLGLKRVGHTGTLDPFATGVILVLVGRATRLAQFLDKDEKEYNAVVRFGYETDTGDRTGSRVGDTPMDDRDVAARLAGTDWGAVLERFRGDVEQVPPMYSAKKIAGRKLYEHARRGESIERKAVAVHVSKIEVMPRNESETGATNAERRLRLRVVCSAGTYIRALAEDIGRAVGVGAHLEELRRTRAGRFDLSRAIGLERFESADEPGSYLLPMDAAVNHLPAFTVDKSRVERTRQGMSTRVAVPVEHGGPIRMIAPDGSLLAIGFFDAAEGSIRPKVVLG
jgi:tRNA pseudouridine55 synthase